MGKKIIYSKPAELIGSLTGIITVPEDFDPKKEKLPLILFLHGAGEVGDGTPKTVEKVCVHGIPKYFSKDPDYKGLRVITVSPQCIDGLIWDHITLQLMNWLNTVIDEFNADRSRISVTGLSMGGFGTWNLISTYPDFFCKAAPVCGGGVPWRIRDKFQGKEILIFHSLDDDAVPYNCSVLMANQATRSGAKVEFTTYSNLGHGCWDAAYETTDLIERLACVK